MPQHLADPSSCWESAHLPFLHDLIVELRPSLLVDAGVDTGTVYFGLCQTIREAGMPCSCYGVLNCKDAVRQASLQVHHEIQFKAFSQLLCNCDPVASFKDASIEFLHISEIAAEMADVHRWIEKLNPSGTLVMSGIGNRDGGTWRLWNQLQDQWPQRFAFRHSAGLGVLRRPASDDQSSDFLQFLFSPSEEIQEYIRHHYVLYSDHIDRICSSRTVAEELEKKTEELLSDLRAIQHERMILELDMRQAQFERNDAQRELESAHRAALLQREESEAHERELHAQIEQLNGALAAERQAIAGLITSWSWRVTAPVRRVMELLRSGKG